MTTLTRNASVVGESSDQIEVDPISTTVLIVDDFLIDRMIAGSILEKIPGLAVTYAADGNEALESIAQGVPALVLSDLEMPGMSGLALVEAIREGYPRLPVILMTSFGNEADAVAALKAGATSYVLKKTIGQDLVETVRQVLALSTIDRQIQRLLSSLKKRESTFCLENDPNLIAPLIQMLQEDLGGMGICDAPSRMRVGVALQEALSNALYHGNLEVSSDLRQEDERQFYDLAERRRREEPYRDRRIHVHASFDRHQVTYTIEDEGPGFDTTVLDRPFDPEDLMRIGGRGMLLIRTFMDEAQHNDRGNRITLVKRGKPRP